MANLPVPYQPNPFQLMGKPYFQPPAVIPQGIIPGMEGLGGVPESVSAGEPAAAALGRMALLKKLALSPFGLAGLAAGAAAYNDPGTGGFDPFLGINPNDEKNDLGISSIGKSMMRGAAKGGNDIGDLVSSLGENSPLFNIPKYLLSSNAEREQSAPKQNVDIVPTGASSSAPAPASAQEFVLPGAVGLGQDSSLDDLMAVLAAEKPTKAGTPPDLINALRSERLTSAAAKGSRDTLGGATKWTGILDLLSANQGVNLEEQLQNLTQDQEYRKESQKWLENYAKTGVDVAKEKREAKKDDFKIHSTKNGFLVEMTDPEGNKVLRPISPFGSSGKLDISGSKFQGDNPLSQELGVLQNLSNVGILNDIMVEHNKDLMGATKGITDPKRVEEAKILTLARAMHQNPQFKASLIQKYVDTMGEAPIGGSLTPDSGLDFLSQLAPDAP